MAGVFYGRSFLPGSSASILTEQLVQRHWTRRRYWERCGAVDRIRDCPQGAAVELHHVYPLPHRGHKPSGGVTPEPSGLSLPMRNIAGERPSLGLQHVDESLNEERFDRMQLLAAHALDLVDDVRPIDLLIDPLASGETAQQRCLLLRPEQDILLV